MGTWFREYISVSDMWVWRELQLACAATFEGVHGCQCDGINHPNQYFEQSQKVLNPQLKVFTYNACRILVYLYSRNVNMGSSCRNLAFVAEWWWGSGPQLARHACCTKLMRWWSGFQAPLHNSLYHEGHAFYMVLETDVMMWEWWCRAQYQMCCLKRKPFIEEQKAFLASIVYSGISLTYVSRHLMTFELAEKEEMSFKTVLLVHKRHDSPATKSTLAVNLVTWSVSNHWSNTVFVGALPMNPDSIPLLLISYKSS